jgi:protein arginine kinase
MSDKYSVTRTSWWVKNDGPDSDVVITSRVRLARNFDKYRFTHLANNEELDEIIRKISVCTNKATDFGQLHMTRMASLKPHERNTLVAKHLVSTELTENPKHKVMILDDDEKISIMVNEEDHLRIQTLLPGLQLEEAWKLASQVDDFLESQIPYAFSEELGYLTACPTNVGTGIRVSAMMHLPALTIANQIGKVLTATSQLGLAVRGLYGEGTQALGNIYQVSNQVTLGHSETELVDNVESVTRQLVNQERNAREILLAERKHQIEDRVHRAYGILANARIISFKETLELLSDVRLGVYVNIIKNVSPVTINELLVMTMPAYLESITGKELPIFERDIMRADIIRDKLQ